MTGPEQAKVPGWFRQRLSEMQKEAEKLRDEHESAQDGDAEKLAALIERYQGMRDACAQLESEILVQEAPSLCDGCKLPATRWMWGRPFCNDDKCFNDCYPVLHPETSDEIRKEVELVRSGSVTAGETAVVWAERCGALLEELRVTEDLLNDRNRLLDMFECAAHGKQCVPHAMEEVERLKLLESKPHVPEAPSVDRIKDRLCAALADHVVQPHAELLDDLVSALVDAPVSDDFLFGVKVEALHQRKRWGNEHDEAKDPQHWFWLLGHLAGKALHAAITGDKSKALHHTISSGAVLLNWHARLSGKDLSFQPGRSNEETDSQPGT